MNVSKGIDWNQKDLRDSFKGWHENEELVTEFLLGIHFSCSQTDRWEFSFGIGCQRPCFVLTEGRKGNSSFLLSSIFLLGRKQGYRTQGLRFHSIFHAGHLTKG
mmetsp:Transcript_20447/g.50826  ORF Transcript_20447/g.50826 Transcript_20447/m.50826 type:complete len:104 (+) Transcript_20447:88-399(+)